MKLLSLTAAAIITAFTASAQGYNPPSTTPPAPNLSDQRYKYAEIIGRQILPTSDLSVRIDSGQVVERSSGRGKPIDGSEYYPYASMAGALNDIRAEGWTFYQAYQIGTVETLYSVRWIVRRKE